MIEICSSAAPAMDLDPEIALFRRRCAENSAHLPPLETLPPAQARRLVEQARAPWFAGGPPMRATREQTLQPADHLPPVRLRIHVPPAPGAGMLVYLHGGGWTMFSLETHDRLMREYADRAGVTVIGVDYALAPEARFPVAIHQVAHVLGALHRHPAALGLTPGPVVCGGDSAGANLALAAALLLRDRADPALPAGLLLSYGVWDAACSSGSFVRYDGPDYMLTRAEMVFFWQRYLPRPDAGGDPLASPLRARLGGLPPCHMAIAACDVLTDENRAMAARLAGAGVAVEPVVYPGTTHSFLEAMSVAAVARRAIDEQAAWIRRTLTGARPAGAGSGA